MPLSREHPSFPVIELMKMPIAALDEGALLDHIFAALERGKGGWLITANLDFLRRYVQDAQMRELYDSADVCVADGMPLVWAARLQGDHLPERVAGSSLLFSLAERASASSRSLYLLGGDEGAASGTKARLERDFPGIRVLGWSRPWLSLPVDTAELDAMAAELERLQPDIILVGLGSPKQEFVIRALRPRLPNAWMVGVGISFSFAAGLIARAPVVLRTFGLEWVHRLAMEPRRLGRRYLIEGIPFAGRLFRAAVSERLQRQRRGTSTDIDQIF